MRPISPPVKPASKRPIIQGLSSARSGRPRYEFTALYNTFDAPKGYNSLDMEFLKTITGKVVTGLIVLGVIAAGISWWQMEPQTREMLVSGAGKILAWLGIVLIMPWVSFAVIGKVARMDSNLAGALLVASYTLVETLLLAWLFNWSLPGATAWTFLIVGMLFAAAYNLFTCDWIAEKAG